MIVAAALICGFAVIGVVATALFIGDWLDQRRDH